MDALFHFAMSFAGGYILLKGLKVDFRLWHLFVLSMIAAMIDIDHVTGLPGQTLVVHSLTFVFGLPVILFLAFRRTGHDNLAIYSLALIVMWIGHLLADMVQGLYGVPLLYPFYDGLFMIPGVWSFIEIDHSYVIAPRGIAVAVYFGVVFTIPFIRNLIKK